MNLNRAKGYLPFIAKTDPKSKTYVLINLVIQNVITKYLQESTNARMR